MENMPVYSIIANSDGEGVFRDILRESEIVWPHFLCLFSENGYTNYFLCGKDKRSINKIKKAIVDKVESVEIDILSESVKEEEIVEHGTCFFNGPLEILGFSKDQRALIKHILLGMSVDTEDILNKGGTKVIHIMRELARRSLREAFYEVLRLNIEKFEKLLQKLL